MAQTLVTRRWSYL